MIEIIVYTNVVRLYFVAKKTINKLRCRPWIDNNEAVPGVESSVINQITQRVVSTFYWFVIRGYEYIVIVKHFYYN